MPNIGMPELLIVLVIVVLIFGAGKLPEVGAALGRAIREFREATSSESAKGKEKEEESPSGPGREQQ